MPNLDYRGNAQVELLGTLKRELGRELDRFPDYTGEYPTTSGMFGSVDAELLYAMVRHVKPSKIVEVGSGDHSPLIRAAAKRNVEDGETPATLITTDPWEPDFLGVLPLRPGDMVFADTSHVWVKDHEIDRLLTLMEELEGVYVHFHDIFLPNGYPGAWSGRSYTEQEHVVAFLANHPEWEVVLGAAYLHDREQAALKATIASYDSERSVPPGSLWLRRGVVAADEWKLDRDADPTQPHMFYSNRNGKQCLVCRKAKSNKLHDRP